MKDVFELDKRFCCPGFQHRVADAGQRGIAVLVVNTSDGIRFRLQSRGIAFDDEKRIGPMPGAPDMQINVSCEVGLQYCPFCGCKLLDLAKASPKAFEVLAEKHRQFYSEL
mgnify:CR=1 FL=1